MAVDRKQLLLDLLYDAEHIRLCSPSADPEKQTGVTAGYHYLVTQIQAHAAPILPDSSAHKLREINVEIDNIYSVYEAKAKLDALVPDIKDALDQVDNLGMSSGGSRSIINATLIGHLAQLEPGKLDTGYLVGICREINSCFAHGNILATVLLMRTVLNHVPPLFGHTTFAQVAAQSPKSLKDIFANLENGLRKIADYHAHRPITEVEIYPTTSQVEPYKGHFELLLGEIIRIAGTG